MTHTLTPWFSELSTIYGPFKGSGLNPEEELEGPIVCSVINREDAAFIVRAVNSHEELLKHIKDCRDEMLACGWSHESLEDVEQAIAKAEAL